MTKIVFTVGRMNPPTIGHEYLIDQCRDLANSMGYDYRIFLTMTHNNMENPLNPDEKLYWAKKLLPNHAKNISHALNPMIAMKKLSDAGYKEICAVCGDDRVEMYSSLLEKYNNHEDPIMGLRFKKWNIIHLDRSKLPVSGTIARQCIIDRDYEGFLSVMPKTQGVNIEQLYNLLIRRIDGSNTQ